MSAVWRNGSLILVVFVISQTLSKTELFLFSILRIKWIFFFFSKTVHHILKKMFYLDLVGFSLFLVILFSWKYLLIK